MWELWEQNAGQLNHAPTYARASINNATPQVSTFGHGTYTIKTTSRQTGYGAHTAKATICQGGGRVQW